MNEHISKQGKAPTDGAAPPYLFEAGDVFSTRGSMAALINELLQRHLRGDWGTLDEEDVQQNELSIKHGMRILSAYILPTTGVKIWVITEADRSATTVLLPEEY